MREETKKKKKQQDFEQQVDNYGKLLEGAVITKKDADVAYSGPFESLDYREENEINRRCVLCFRITDYKGKAKSLVMQLGRIYISMHLYDVKDLCDNGTAFIIRNGVYTTISKI